MTARAFGHYEIVETLGSGGMGVVYRARDTRLGREVAIKVLRQDASWTAAARERLLREARAISKLNHPNICTVHDIGDRAGETFIVMELVEGGQLTHRLSGRGLDSETAVRWGAQLADALEHAHQHGVIHRDVKPSNVVVTPAGHVKLVDFGIAARGPGDPNDTTVFETVEGAAVVAGTPSYMAPEVIRGGIADSRSDIWSLGVLLHESLSGKRPFDGPTREEVTTAILRDAPTPLPNHVPQELVGIVRRCLAKDPAARYQRAGELRAALEAVAPGARSGGRRRAVWVAVAAGVAALGMAAIVMTSDRLSGRVAQLVGVGNAPRTMPQIGGLAVLPLRNLGGDREQDFFADGMTSALITELARVPTLNVISQTSVMRYRDRADRSLPQIGAELGVEAIVEGSVLRVGDRVRISVDLVHVGTDRHLWAESYEQPLRDVLTLQRDIARAVVAHVQSRVGGGLDSPGTRAAQVHPEAYDFFLRGEISVAQANPVGVDRAVDYYERAIALDPRFAPAHAGLAGALFAQEFWGTAPFQSNLARVRASTATALALDAALADAHVMNARILLNYDWDWAGAEASLKRAIELSPGFPFAYETYCWLLLGQGRRDEAIVAARKAAALDPRSPYMAFTEARVLHRVRRYKEAEENYKKAMNLDPGLQMALGSLAHLYINQRRLAEARAVLDRRDRLPSVRTDTWARAALEALSGNERRGRELAASLPPPLQARVYAALGDRDAAFSALERGIANRTILIAQWGDADLDPLRSDPRFARLVERMGLPVGPLVAWGSWPQDQ